MNGMRSVRRAAAAAAAVAWVVCAACANDRDPAPPRERRMQTVAWDTVFTVASNAQDSTLLMPFRPVGGGGGVYVADFYGNRVLHFDRRGGLRWRFGRTGSGPDEFRRIRDLKLDSAGHVWVLDEGNLRATVLDSAGSVLERIPLDRINGSPQLLVPLGGAGPLVVVDRTDSPFVRVRGDGSVVERRVFPWDGFRELSYLAGQFTSGMRPGSNTWAAAMQMGDGFFVFHGTRWAGYRGRYVERVEFPQIERRRVEGGEVTQFKTPPVEAGKSVTLSPTRVYVLFGGTGAHSRRIVDTYAVANGRYLGSVVLPRRVDSIAWDDGGFYVVYNSPYPTLAYWRPRGVALQ